jgi:hypothetical protein
MWKTAKNVHNILEVLKFEFNRTVTTFDINIHL